MKWGKSTGYPRRTALNKTQQQNVQHEKEKNPRIHERFIQKNPQKTMENKGGSRRVKEEL